MIFIDNLTLARQSKPLLEQAQLNVFSHQKIGLVGSNGCGKSSLFAALESKLAPTDGDIHIQKGLRMSSLAQETPGLDISAVQYVMDGDQQLKQIEMQLQAAEKASDYDQIMKLHEKLADIDGYNASVRASKLLHGLGFSNEQLDLPIKSFSGGWRVRLGLAQCLMAPSDILLLDEPTNHLDMEAIVWLEKWLKSYQGAIIVISHDRDFLDGVVTHIVHVENRKLKAYTGGYSSFEGQRAEALALQMATHKKQQAKMKHMMDFVSRFRAKASKAKQAQSRIKAIAKMEVVAAVNESSAFSFEFFNSPTQPNPLLQIRNGVLGYGDTEVLHKVSLSLTPGARIGLLGMNGAGKSTLVKCLANTLPIRSGNLISHPSTKIGYFDQHQVDRLNLDQSPLGHMSELDPKSKTAALRSYLGSFGFSGDLALTPTGKLSGGEKSRLALAIIVWNKPNLLLLDEPTNHLDMEMRNALAIALQAYEGCLVLISHDRYLLRSTVNEYMLVANKTVTKFDGDLDDYKMWYAKAKKESMAT